MDWIFVRDIGFYALLGLLTFVPLMVIVAAVGRKRYGDAHNALNDFLKKWASIAPDSFLKVVFRVAGTSTVLVLLGFLAYSLNRLGDSAMPHTSSWVGFFGSKKTGWSIELEAKWDSVKYEFRKISDIRTKRQEWEQKKAELGKYDLRFFRTSFFLFLMVFAAGFIDIVYGGLLSKRGKTIKNKASPGEIEPRRGELRKRGYWLVFIGLLGLILSQWLWVDRQTQYVKNLVAQYMDLYEQRYGEGEIPRILDSYFSYGRKDVKSDTVIVESDGD